MNSYLSTALLLLGTAHAVNVTFHENKGCSGQPLFGDVIDGTLGCYDLSSSAPTNSTSFDAFQPGQVIHFYSDAACKNQVYQSAEDKCYLHTRTEVNSVRVSTSDSKDAGDDDQSKSGSTTTDLEVYEMQDYSNVTDISTYVRIPYSNFFIAVGLGAIGYGISFANLGLTCEGAFDPPTGSGIFSCLASPVSSILTFVAGIFAREGIQEVRERWRARTGTITNAKREIDNYNDFYMSEAMSATGEHVGYLEHDLGTGLQSSPVYEVSADDKTKYHIAAFYDASTDSQIHRMYPAHAAKVNKRDGPGYLSVTYDSGGLDFATCNINTAADISQFSSSRADNYNTFYDDISCLVSQDEFENADAAGVDIFDGNSNLITTVQIAPFDGTRGGLQGRTGACGISTRQSSSCVN